ncbi:MAG: hypothetical protein ABI589_04695 [Burkholderiales bacterium]
MFAQDNLNRYPLRQLLLPAAEGDTPLERPGVVDLHSRPDSYLVISEERGGRIYAANESALKEAQQVAAAAHGEGVILADPYVHTFHEAALAAKFEPVMYLRVKVPSGYAEAVLQDLEQRGVRIMYSDVKRLDAVIRAEGRLADLLGYEEAVQTLTLGTAVVWNWLLRYEAARPLPFVAGTRPREARSDPAALGARQRQTPALLSGFLRNATP